MIHLSSNHGGMPCTCHGTQLQSQIMRLECVENLTTCSKLHSKNKQSTLQCMFILCYKRHIIYKFFSVEKDLYLPSLPGKATADFFSTMDLPKEWTLFLRHLNNTHIFASSPELRGRVITFTCEYKRGQPLAAAHQLSLYLCSGQYQRQALGFKGDLYGATIVDGILRLYVSRWEGGQTVVGAISLFPFYYINNNKGVYPTPYKFSLATFPDFLKCYIFLCKVADYAAAEVIEVLTKWRTKKGRAQLEETARKASEEQPWRPNIPVTPAASCKFTQFQDGAPQEDVEPYMMEEDWESYEEDTGDRPVILGIEDEAEGNGLTRANLEAISSDGTAKYVQNWTHGLFERSNDTTLM